MAPMLIAPSHIDANQPMLADQEATARSKFRSQDITVSRISKNTQPCVFGPAADPCLQASILPLDFCPLVGHCPLSLTAVLRPAVCELKTPDTVCPALLYQVALVYLFIFYNLPVGVVLQENFGAYSYGTPLCGADSWGLHRKLVTEWHAHSLPHPTHPHMSSRVSKCLHMSHPLPRGMLCPLHM